MAQYQRLTLMEREELSRMLAAGSSLRAAAQALQRAPSTLSRELTRHRTSPRTYRAVLAHYRAQRWAHQPRKLRTLAVHARLTPPSCICSRTAGRLNRLRTACHSGILTIPRCAFRMKPSIPI